MKQDFLLPFFLLLLPHWIRAQCPQVGSPCVCSSSIYEPVSIVCDNAGGLPNALRALANVRNVQITTLAVLNTPIPNLPANAFQGLNIERLVLNRNSMRTMDPQAFSGSLQESLQELDLRDNPLSVVPQNGVAQLKKLRSLILARTTINSLSPRAFSNYASREFLGKIDLSGNRLTQIDSTVFVGLPNLEEVNLAGNSLTTVPTQAFSEQRNRMINLNLGNNNISNVQAGALDFPSLRSLSLEYNGITAMTPETFRGVPSLLYLYVGGNKFPSWNPEMFRYVGGLQILGIGSTQIERIPANAFQFIPSLIRLEMSDAAVVNIDQGAFQRVRDIQAIIMNKNKLRRIRADMFQGLNRLYTLDLSANQLDNVEDRAFANLPALRHLDISVNDLQTLPRNVFANTFLPSSDTRVLYLCENKWVCDERLDWFRKWLRENPDIVIDKQLGCIGMCKAPTALDNVRLRDENPSAPFTEPSVLPTEFEGLIGGPTSYLHWIILGIILAILLASILMLAIVRWFVSRRRKKDKDAEEDEQRIVGSATSGYQPPGSASVVGSGYPASAIDLDLPPATTLDDRDRVAYWY